MLRILLGVVASSEPRYYTFPETPASSCTNFLVLLKYLSFIRNIFFHRGSHLLFLIGRILESSLGVVLHDMLCVDRRHLRVVILVGDTVIIGRVFRRVVVRQLRLPIIRGGRSLLAILIDVEELLIVDRGHAFVAPEARA